MSATIPTNAVPASPQRRRWFQFTLTSVLALISFAALAAAYIRSVMQIDDLRSDLAYQSSKISHLEELLESRDKSKASGNLRSPEPLNLPVGTRAAVFVNPGVLWEGRFEDAVRARFDSLPWITDYRIQFVETLSYSGRSALITIVTDDATSDENILAEIRSFSSQEKYSFVSQFVPRQQPRWMPNV